MKRQTMKTDRAASLVLVAAIYLGAALAAPLEAALAATYRLIVDRKARGLYFALRTQVTSNRIHLRVQSFVDRISVDSEKSD